MTGVRSPIACDGPVPRAFAPIALPLSWAYRVIVALRNARYDRGRGVRAVSLPTISVGNLVVGGTGKSPMVGWIARALREMGHRPLIALRGYGASDPRMSDEAIEHRERNPEVPVVTGADRLTAISEALRHGIDVDCVILDDAFQHRRLHRDLDLVLVDARRPWLDGRMLPAGWLREPPSALARADAVIVTHATGVDANLARAIGSHHGRPPVAWMEHVWDGLDAHESTSGDAAKPRELPVEWLEGRRVVAMLGLADPSAVVRMAERAGAIVELLPMADHARYGPEGVARLADAMRRTQSEAALVTGKDWAKLRPLLDSSSDSPFSWPIVVPRLRIRPIVGDDALRTLLRGVLPPPAASPRAAAPAGTAP